MAKIRVKSEKYSEFNTSLKIKGAEFHIQTDQPTAKNPFITTTAYNKGTVIDSQKTPIPSGETLSQERLKDFMKKQHKRMIDRIKERFDDTPDKKVNRKVLYNDLKKLMDKRKWRDAYELAEEAARMYQNDPFLLLYFSYLRARVTKEYRNAVLGCNEAIEMLKEQMPVGGDFYYPLFYLHLGRIYVMANKKDNAIDSLRKGLKYDPGHAELFRELQALGFRKTPPIPFLSRDNFINKYLGIALSKLGLR